MLQKGTYVLVSSIAIHGIWKGDRAEDVKLRNEFPIAHILDDMLTKADPDYKQKPDIKWNFTKFLINKKGMVVARFEPTEKIEIIENQIEELLK